jgi:phosphatidylglycerophosphatase A
LGFIGRIGFAPGTWGSLASLILWAPLVLGGVSFWVHLLVALAVFALGCWCIKGDDDAPEIVIDEAAGMGFATLFCMPTLASIAIAFVLFRVFDILKPWPISLADRSIKGPFGIMFDDVLAGGMAVVVTRVIGTLPI